MPATREGTPPDHSGVVVPPPLVYVGCFLLGLGLERLWPLPAPAPRNVAYVLAGIGLWSWFAISAWAFYHFWRRDTTVIPTRPTSAIVVSGPFRWTRNPLYVGLVLGYAGLAFALDRTWPLLLLPLAAVIVDRAIIPREERYLERKFGEEYLSYKRRVRRWL